MVAGLAIRKLAAYNQNVFNLASPILVYSGVVYCSFLVLSRHFSYVFLKVFDKVCEGLNVISGQLRRISYHELNQVLSSRTVVCKFSVNSGNELCKSYVRA